MPQFSDKALNNKTLTKGLAHNNSDDTVLFSSNNMLSFNILL